MYADDQVALYGLTDSASAGALRAKLHEAMEILTDDDLRAIYDDELGLPPRRKLSDDSEDASSAQLAMNELLTGADRALQSTHPFVPFSYVSGSKPPEGPPAVPPAVMVPPPALVPPPLAVLPDATPTPPPPPGVMSSARVPPPAVEAAPPPPSTPRAPEPPPVVEAAPPPSAPRPEEPSPPPAPSVPRPAESAPPPAQAQPEPPQALPPPPPSAPTAPPPSAPGPVVFPPPRPSPAQAPELSENAAIAVAESQLAKVAHTVAQRDARASAPRPKPPDLPADAEFNGELLRKVRTAMGLTIQQIADKTRISARHIESIEADRYAALPVPVYLRGILMNLSRELGLDGLRVAKSYLALVEKAKG